MTSEAVCHCSQSRINHGAMLSTHVSHESLLTCLLAPRFTIATIMFSVAMNGSSWRMCRSITYSRQQHSYILAAKHGTSNTRWTFVHSLQTWVQPTLDPSAETLCRPNAPAQGEEGIGRCVQCMCALCRVEEGTVGVNSSSGISKRAPSRRGLLSG